MKNVIFYFTGTGNSLVIAKDIAAGLGETELVSIPVAMKEPADRWLSAETVGFVFPVYFEGPPIMVNEWIRRMQMEKGQYIYAVANCGGTFGTTLVHLDRLLKEKGAKLSFGELLMMPGNYIAWYDAFSPKTQQAAFEREKTQVKAVIETIRSRKKGKVKKDNFFINWFFSGLWYPAFVKQAPSWDDGFFSDEKCNGCATCARLCPTNNITLENNKPVWNHRCEQCFACIQWCPKEAVQCNKDTHKRRRYRHPEVKLKDMIQSVPDEAAK